MVFLTGCGARVISQTEFDYGGGGMRDVQIYISDIVDEVTEEDLDKIDEILKAAVPEGMNYARSVEENGELKYHFMFSFTDIDDYNEKVLAFTGKRHHATWYTADSVFLSDIAFSEKECGYDLASWAVKALQKSEYKRFTTAFDSNTPQESIFLLEGEEVFRGAREDPSFEKAMAPEVTDVTMFSDFAENEEPRKKLVLKADAEKMMRMDVARASKELAEWCADTKIDRANGVITLNFKDEAAFRAFAEKADPDYAEEKISYINEISPFKVQFEVREDYRLAGFLDHFLLKTEYIKDYISVPELPYSTLEHLSTVTNLETVEGYKYQGAYRKDLSYLLQIRCAVQSELLSMDVFYTFNTPESGERQVKLIFAKNGLPLTKKVLEDALALRGITAEAADLGETLSATCVTKIGPANRLRFEDVKDHNPSKISRAFTDTCAVTEYLPSAGKGPAASENVKQTVHVTMTEAAKATGLSIGGTAYAEKDLTYTGGACVIETSWEGERLDLEIATGEDSMSFRIIVTIVLLILAVIFGGILIYYFRKRQAEKSRKERGKQ